MKDTRLCHKRSTAVTSALSGLKSGIAIAYGTLLISLCTQTAFAQLKEVRTHRFNDYDVKNYSMNVLKGTGKTILAGTLFSLSGETSIHLMLSDNTTVPGNTFLVKNFDDAGFDERAIDAHFWRGNVDDLIIIASRRDVNGGPMMIEVLYADGAGHILSGNVISDKAGENLHPLGTMLQDDQLYICGYTTRSGGPWIPDYRTDKEIFIVQYDLQQERVVQSFRHNYPTAGPGNDYDMATRIKMLRNGNIFVTGSCNVDDPAVPLYDSPSKGYYCGTLSLTLDAGLNLIHDKPISAYMPVVGGTSIIARGEAGFDITEDPAGDGYFIFSNTFVAEAETPIPLMQPIHVTFVDNNMDIPSARQNRYRGPGFDVVWGVNLVEGNSPATTILSGYQNSRPWPNTPFPTLSSNINPFLAELKLEYTGVIDVQALYFSTMLSSQGTGDPLVYPNNFTDLGGYFSNLAWGPPNARRDLSSSGGIFLSAPVWNPAGYNKLNMKMIHAWENGTVDCPIDYKFQISGDVVNTWTSYPGTRTPDIADNVRYYTEQDYDPQPDQVYDCYDASSVFRPTGIASRDGITTSVTLSPNPAQDYIVVTVEGLAGDAAVSISLTDITGKHLGILYEGKTSGLKSRRLKLPSLARGLYMVVTAGKDRTLSTQKLEVR